MTLDAQNEAVTTPLLPEALVLTGRRFRLKEFLIEKLLLLAGASSILITVGIVGILIYEASGFFEHVSVVEFLTDTQWTPLFAGAHYGILPMLCGTLVTTGVALLVAIPVGTIAAIWLSEYSPKRLREIIKPALELLGAVPSSTRRTSCSHVRRRNSRRSTSPAGSDEPAPMVTKSCLPVA